MTRLQTEFRRLYHPDVDAPDRTTPGLIDAHGRVRALVLELTGPADAAALGAVWRGVQTELGLPAPAIAASGTDGLQLWFSVVEPLTVDAARDWLDSLRRRWLFDLAPRRVRLWPATVADSGSARHAPPIPAEIGSSGNWSAFLAPDLAPLFAETPWLDTPPGDDGQAALLAPLASIGAQALESAWAQLRPAAPAPAPAHVAEPLTAALANAAGTHSPSTETDPRRFLTSVMADPAAPLALRIEAARTLLQHPPEPETSA